MAHADMAELEREKEELRNERKKLEKRQERLEERQERLEERHERLEEERQGLDSQASADVWKAYHQAQKTLKSDLKHLYGQWDRLENQWEELNNRKLKLKAVLQAESGMYFSTHTHARAQSRSHPRTHQRTHTRSLHSYPWNLSPSHVFIQFQRGGPLNWLEPRAATRRTVCAWPRKWPLKLSCSQQRLSVFCLSERDVVAVLRLALQILLPSS